jgi:hypothetical protein
MTRRGTRQALCIVAAAAAAAIAGGPARAGNLVAAHPVSTLAPAATAKLWRQLVAHPTRFRAVADCRALRAVFYAQTDWLRLATKLAANASPCAEYYISIPPLVADKTQFRPDQAWRIRALGSNFHAMAEVHWTTWKNWVAANGSTFFAAGVEARRRMAAAGYDVTKGDIWAVNELPSSVRTGAGSDRQNARDFLRGLYEGDGTTPVKGAVFVIGVGQPTSPVAPYQSVVQNWLSDSGFWTDMSAYVADWSQEVYGDVRNVDVPGAPVQTRRDYLNDYLQHVIVVARAGPPTIAAAHGFLESAYSPLANAAWQWASGYGWTMVPFDQMAGFVSVQTYALRAFTAATGEPQDHWGFAWAPRNGTGLSVSDFASQTGAILDRLGAAIRDSAQTVDPADPGIGACGAGAQLCGGDQPGATFTALWQSFRTWTQPVLSFTTPPQTIPAGTPSAAISLALLTSAGTPQIATAPLAITLTSSSPQGQFSTAPTGPWSSTLTLTMPAGSNAAGPFYYQDTRADSPVLTAAAFGVTSGTQTETVQPGPAVSVNVTPATATVNARATQTLTASGVDSFGNAFPVTATWSVDPADLGTLKPLSGPTTTFTGGGRAGTGTVTATAGALSGSSTVTVRPGSISAASVRYGIGKKVLLVSVVMVDTGRRPVAGALVSVLVRRRGYAYFSGHGRTAANGRAIFRIRSKPGCYRTTLTRASAPGYTWHPGTPPNRFCK